MADAKVITVYSTKGGVGKTTTTLHLADYLAKKGAKVAMIDADERAMLTATVMEMPEDLQFPVYFFENMASTDPAHGAQVVAAMIEKIEEAKEGVDYLIVDCGGYNSQASLAAGAISDLMIIPANTGRYDMQQTEEVWANTQEVARSMGLKPIVRVLVTRVNLATNLFAAFVGALKVKGMVPFANAMPSYAAIAESSFSGGTIFNYRPVSQAASFMRRSLDEIYEVLTEGAEK
jgi:cellulose biosynthesis protein BcsQ